MEEKRGDHLLIDECLSQFVRPKLRHEYVNLAHSFSLLKSDPRAAFENLLTILFMAPLLVGRGDIARRNLILLKELVDKLEMQGGRSALMIRIVEEFYRGYDSVIMKINKVQQVYAIDIDLSFLKELNWEGRKPE